MNTKNLVCTVCPNSCNLTVDLNSDGQAEKVIGNRCPRGEEFAKQEILCPMRVLTTTVLCRLEDGTEEMLPVRSSDSIALDKHCEAMKIIRHTTVKSPVKMGNIIISNILKTNVDIIASCNL